jgi:hypothetical protein
VGGDSPNREQWTPVFGAMRGRVKDCIGASTKLGPVESATGELRRTGMTSGRRGILGAEALGEAQPGAMTVRSGGIPQ